MFYRCQTPPKNECFYNHTGNLVDENHKFPGCRGTPNQYGKDSPFSHTFLDTGGILKQGWDASGKAKDIIKEAINANNYEIDGWVIDGYGLDYPDFFGIRKRC